VAFSGILKKITTFDTAAKGIVCAIILFGFGEIMIDRFFLFIGNRTPPIRSEHELKCDIFLKLDFYSSN
jgi:hypothetical protein